MKNDKITQLCLIILASVAVVGALIYAKGVIVPFVISFFVYATILPISNMLQNKLKLPKVVSLLLISGVFSLLFVATSFFIVQSVGTFVEDASKYNEKIVHFIDQGTVLLNKYGVSLDTGEIKEAIKKLPIAKMFQAISGGIFSIAGNLTLILIITLFLLTGDSKQTNKSPMVLDVKNKISKYISTKFLTSFSTGLLVGLIFFFFGVDMAVLFALLTFLFNFIPSVGSIIATLIPVPILILQFGLGVKFGIILILCGIIQMVIGNVIEPKIMGENMDLHPITILLFLIFWGTVWGIPGMFMAVPITAIVKIVLSKIDVTKPISELLSGRLS